jgi:DNA polymerase-3 subunit alpha
MPVTGCLIDRGLEKGGHSALPDIDIDFASDRRSEIREYLEERYSTNGKRRVFSAGTFTTLKLKAALKDVSRVYKIPVAQVNAVTSLLNDDSMTWTDFFKLAAFDKTVRQVVENYPQVSEGMRPVMGQPRAASIHASAIVVTPESRDGEPAECFDFLPVRQTDGMLVSEFDGAAVEEIGLLKEDVLASKELSRLGAIIRIVNENYGKNYTVESITQNETGDRKTYALLSAGYTQNIFQFSARGITRFIMDVAPENIEDLIAVNALYRPATLETGATEDYIRYRRGERTPVYRYGTYEATGNTYGILCYQEQFMSIAHTLGGFDLGKTDFLRKAIGKKNPALMATLKQDFIDGAIQNGCPEYEAQEIWKRIELAGKYSFNRSHAAAYALTAFCGAWLKANYPTAFYTVALQWADDREMPLLLSEMEQCSAARTAPPEINLSGAGFVSRGNEIFLSLSRIRMLGVKAVDFIVTERERNGHYRSIEDFIQRIFRHRLRKCTGWDEPDSGEEAGRIPVNARHVKNLILAGCFDRIENIPDITGRYGILKRAAATLGFNLHEKDFPKGSIEEAHFWAMEQVNVSGVGQMDYRRIYENSPARKQIKGKIPYMSLKEALQPENEGRKIAVCATVIALEEVSYTDKSTLEKKQFAKVKLQQNSDLMELVCWNTYYREHREEFTGIKDKTLILTATIKYSDYSLCNTLQMLKTSLLFTL